MPIQRLKKTYKLFFPFITTICVTTILVAVFSIYFFFQYSTEMERRIYALIDEFDEIDIFHLCIEVDCNGIYYGDKYYGVNKSTQEINLQYTKNIKVSPQLCKYGNISLRKNLSFIIPIHPKNGDKIVYFSVDISRFKNSFILLYVVLITIFNVSVGIILYMVLAREKILNGIELSKDKTTLQFDNLMFYIENLNHEVNSPLFVLSRKLKELKNNIQGNEKTFDILFNSIEQINAVMQRTREVKKINKISEDRTIFDLIERTIATISVMRSETINCITDEKLKDYYLDQNLMSNGTFVNILTNHIKNSIEAFADIITSNFVSEKNNKLRFTFSDNGNGIEKKYRKFIFDKGFSTKGDNLVRGSGLAINKFIIESTGGSIKLNDVNQGTQFEITIPVKRTF